MLFILLLALSVGAKASMLDLDEADFSFSFDADSDADSDSMAYDLTMIDENERMDSPTSSHESDIGEEETVDETAYDDSEEDDKFDYLRSYQAMMIERNNAGQDNVRNCPTPQGSDCFKLPGYCINDDDEEAIANCTSNELLEDMCPGNNCTCCKLEVGQTAPPQPPTTSPPVNCQDAWGQGCCPESGGSCQQSCGPRDFVLSVNCAQPDGCPATKCCKRCRNNCECSSGLSPGRCIGDAFFFHRRRNWFRYDNAHCPDSSCKCFKRCTNGALCKRYGGHCIYRRNSCRRGHVKVNCGCKDRENCSCCVPIRNYAEAAKQCGCNSL